MTVAHGFTSFSVPSAGACTVACRGLCVTIICVFTMCTGSSIGFVSSTHHPRHCRQHSKADPDDAGAAVQNQVSVVAHAACSALGTFADRFFRCSHQMLNRNGDPGQSKVLTIVLAVLHCVTEFWVHVKSTMR